MPSLDVGWVADDYIHRSFIQDHLQTRNAKAPWWNVFDTRASVFEQVAVGGLPWWTSPNLKVALFRPLATLSHYVDYLLWPNHPAWMHLHNVVLYVLIVLVATELYFRLFGAQQRTALLAALLYAADDAHALGTAWIASRNTLLTTLFALGCFSLYVRGRVTGSRAARQLAPFSLLLAHANSEGAIAIWAYLLAWSALLDPAPPLARLRALAPLMLVSVAWLSLTALLGYGVSGSGAYLDPRTDPLGYLAALPHRLASLLLSQFGVAEEPRLDWPAGLRHVHDVLVYMGLALGVLALARVWRKQPLALFFAAGCFGALLPICAVGPASRLLFISSFGAHAAIAMLLAAVPWSRAQRLRTRAARGFGGLCAAA
ncbi:MAG TPA: hypothetical protein VJR89_14460, partial [Polyangiales bacterium]|nr:hypothetical protein [Polyangiales bacterium]